MIARAASDCDTESFVKTELPYSIFFFSNSSVAIIITFRSPKKILTSVASTIIGLVQQITNFFCIIDFDCQFDDVAML